MGEIADPLFRLSQVTEIMGQHYRAALDTGGPNPERVLWLFTEAVIDGLKAVDRARTMEAHVSRAMITGESWIRTTVEGVELIEPHDIASPND